MAPEDGTDDDALVNGDETFWSADANDTITTINASGSTARHVCRVFLRGASPASWCPKRYACRVRCDDRRRRASFCEYGLNGSTVASVDTFTTGSGGGFELGFGGSAR